MFNDKAIIRLQHQISALSSALDDAYAARQRPQPGGEASRSASGPPSEALQAVKQSLDYWHRTVAWICRDDLDHAATIGDPVAFSEAMRVALTEQANIWQTLVTCQQTLDAFTVETVTEKIMRDVTEELKRSARADLPATIKRAQQVMIDISSEAKAGVEAAARIGREGLEALFRSVGPTFWVIGALGVLLVVLAVVALLKGSGAELTSASLGTLVTGGLSTVAAYFGFAKAKQDKEIHQGRIQSTQDDATKKIDNQKAASTSAADQLGAGGRGLLARLEGIAEGAAAEVFKAFERALEQIRVELKSLSRSIAISYPLLEFIGKQSMRTNRPGGEQKQITGAEAFLANVLWTKEERDEKVRHIAAAALGPLAAFIGSTDDKRTERAGAVYETATYAQRVG